ncbi:hypothetical protein Vretifemale_4471 [Volvox reticuliferus]|uniref:Uncharacterized protein n=1 Tax=Volvox reticuliferus TaxID=1737510 RepID=A0A8J4C5R4_9CHLO|nr:hypothetical protein Vretifemale_4471 [Volvox reticuliferus]
MEAEPSLGGNHVSIVAKSAQAEGLDQEDRDGLFSAEFIDTILLYTHVLPGRALQKGPLFRRNCPLYSKPRLRHDLLDASPLYIKALQAANGSGAAVRCSPTDVYKGWLYVAVILCVEPCSCPNRLVPFPGSAWMLAFPPAPNQATSVQQQQQQENWEQKQDAVGMSADVVAEAAAVAMAAGWRPFPCDRQLGTLSPAGFGNGGVGSSYGGGGGGGACSLPLPLSDYDLQEASQIRLLLIYSDAVSDRASRLSLPATRRLESMIDADMDLAFNTFPMETPVWAAVLAPTEAAASALSQVRVAAAAAATHGLGPAAAAPLCNYPLQWRATLGSVHARSCTGVSQHTTAEVYGGPSGTAAARAGGKAELDERVARIARCPPPAESVGCLRVRMAQCTIRRHVVWDTFNPAIHRDAPEAEVVTLALEPYGEAESVSGGGGVALRQCGRADSSNRGGAATTAGVFVDVVLRGWTQSNMQSPHQITAVLPDNRTAALCTDGPAATKAVAGARTSGGELVQPTPQLPSPPPSRCCRAERIQQRWQQRRRRLLRKPPEDLDELVFRGNKRDVFWIWHARPCAGDSGDGDDNSEGVGASDRCRVPDSDPNPQQSAGARPQGGAVPPDPGTAPSPAPHEPGPRWPSAAGLSGGRGERWGRELHAEASDNLRCGICKSPYAYDSLASLMAHVWSCHSQLTAALEYEEPNTAAADDETSYVCIHLMRCRDSVDWRSLLRDIYGGPRSGALRNRRMRLPLVKSIEEDWVMYRGRIFETITRDMAAGYEVEVQEDREVADAAEGADKEGEALPLPTHPQQQLEEEGGKEEEEEGGKVQHHYHSQHHHRQDAQFCPHRQAGAAGSRGAGDANATAIHAMGVPPTGLAAIGDGLPLGVLPQQHAGTGAWPRGHRNRLCSGSGVNADDAIVIFDDDDVMEVAEVENPWREDADGTIFILSDEDDDGVGGHLHGGGGGDASMGGNRTADGDRVCGKRACGGSQGGGGGAADVAGPGQVGLLGKAAPGATIAATAVAAQVVPCETLASAGAFAVPGANPRKAAAEVNVASRARDSARTAATNGSVSDGGGGAERRHGRRRMRSGWDNGSDVGEADADGGGSAGPWRSNGCHHADGLRNHSATAIPPSVKRMRLQLPDPIPLKDLVSSAAAAAAASTATAARMRGHRVIRRKLLQPLRLVLLGDFERQAREQAGGNRGAWLEADKGGSFGEDSGGSGGSAEGVGGDKPAQLSEGGYFERSLRDVAASSAAAIAAAAAAATEAAATETAIPEAVSGGGSEIRGASMHGHGVRGPDGEGNVDRGDDVGRGHGGIGVLSGGGIGGRGADGDGGRTDTQTGLPAVPTFLPAVAAAGPSCTKNERHSPGGTSIDGKCDPRVDSVLGVEANRVSDAGPSTMRVLQPLELHRPSLPELRALQPLQRSPGMEGSGCAAMRKRPASAAGGAGRFRRQGGAPTYRRRALVKPSIQQATQPGLCQDFRKPRLFVHSRSLMPLSKEEVERRFNAAMSPAATAAGGYGVAAAAAAEAPQRPGPPGALNMANPRRPQVGAMAGIPLASDSDSDTDDEEWEVRLVCAVGWGGVGCMR